MFQLLQLLQFDFLGVRFLFVVAISVGIGLDWPGAGFYQNLGSMSEIIVGTDPTRIHLVLNLIALICLLLLLSEPEAQQAQPPKVPASLSAG